MKENILQQAKKIHFIGIGGIGISAVARMLLLEGKQVSGSDRDASKVTDELKKAGATIFIGQKKENLPDCVIQAGIPADCDLIVYTVAIPKEDPEFVQAINSGVKMLTYPETLNLISKEKYTIAVSGTHGKTTVTAMIAKIMIDAGFDPTVIVGSLLKDIGANMDCNFVAGKSKYLVVEADEYKKSFHNLEPSILVINNIDEDHLDFYKDLTDIQNSFLHLAQKIPKDGFLVCNTKLPNLQPIINGVKPARTTDGVQSGGCQVVDYDSIILKPKLLVPGDHNRQNAKAAFAVAKVLGADLDKVASSLAGFTGAWRRFEFKGKTESGALVYDDYAHNPQKVRAALEGARELFPDKKIIVVFQPHLYSRTKLLLNEFAKSFNDADEVILTPIFPAREPFDPSISSEILAERISCQKKAQTQVLGSPPLLRNKCRPDHSPDQFSDSSPVHVFGNFSDVEVYLKTSLGPSDLLITMGAGEQYKIGENLLAQVD